MGRQPPSIRPALGHDHARGDGSGIPAEVAPDPRREAALAIERPEQLAHVDDLGLELDHEQRPPRRMPAEKIDHATLAIDRERDLGPELPAIKPEPSHHGVAELAVALAQESVRRCTPPSSAQVDPNLECACYPSERAQRRARQVPPFDPRDGDIRHASHGCDVPLPHAPPHANGSKHAAKTQVIHDGQ